MMYVKLKIIQKDINYLVKKLYLVVIKCYGVNTETKCPLNNECPTFKPIFIQDADSYCKLY